MCVYVCVPEFDNVFDVGSYKKLDLVMTASCLNRPIW